MVFCRTLALGVWKNISLTSRIQFWYFFQHLLISGQSVPIWPVYTHFLVQILAQNTFFEIISWLFGVWRPSGAQKASIYFAFYDFDIRFNICWFLPKIWLFFAIFWPEINKCWKKYQNRIRPAKEIFFHTPSASVREKTTELGQFMFTDWGGVPREV